MDVNKISRVQQKAIYSLIRDLANETGYTLPELESRLKGLFWGEKEGKMSLSLDSCSMLDAYDFYRFILDICFEIGVTVYQNNPT